MFKYKTNTKSGITLIALVVTIIVLLILAGISVQMLTGDNGLITRTGQLKEINEGSKEIEDISLVYASLVSKAVLDGEIITDLTFEEELNNNGDDTIVGYDDNNNYIVYFNKTKKSYLVKKDGNISEYEHVPLLITETIYVTLYTDGQMTFRSTNEVDSSKSIKKTYTIGMNDIYNTQDMVPWNNERTDILKVTFVDEIKPTSTKRWFRSCLNLTTIENIYNLNTSQVKDMSHMFCGCRELTELDLSTFDTRRVSNMLNMFCSYADDGSAFGEGMSLTSLNLSNFDTRNVTDFYNMFSYCNKLTSIDVSSFNTSKAQRMYGMFSNCHSLRSLDLSNFDTKNVTFNKNLTVPDYQGMRSMFYNCENLVDLNICNFNTENVTDMGGMFSNCKSLKKLDISSFNTQNVTSMSSMFNNCRTLTNLDLSGFNTINVVTMGSMFYNCRNLANLKLNSFNTSNVTNMSYMFYNCRNLANLKLNSFNTSNVTNMSYMFKNCIKLRELDLSSFDTSKLQTTQGMFNGWDDELNSALTYSLQKIYVGNLWNLSSVTNSLRMFGGCNNLVGEKGTTFNSKKNDKEYARIDGGPTSSKPGYFTYRNN